MVQVDVNPPLNVTDVVQSPSVMIYTYLIATIAPVMLYAFLWYMVALLRRLGLQSRANVLPGAQAGLQSDRRILRDLRKVTKRKRVISLYPLGSPDTARFKTLRRRRIRAERRRARIFSSDSEHEFSSQSGIERSTIVSLVAFLTCTYSELTTARHSPARFVAECALFGAALSADPAFEAVDFQNLLSELAAISTPVNRAAMSSQSGFENPLKSQYFRKMITLAALVIGTLMSYQTKFSFDQASFMKSGFADDMKMPKVFSVVDLVSEVVSSLTSRTEYFRESGDWRAFFMDDFDNRGLLLKINSVLSTEETIKASNYAKAGYSSSYDCLLKIDGLIAECNEAVKGIRANTTIIMGLMKLESLRLYIMARSQGNCLREQPFGVLISGKSGVLKSVLSGLTMKQLLCTLGLPNTSEYVGMLNLEEEFQSTYEPHYAGVILDDLANTKAEMSGVILTQKIIELINNAPVCTNQADIARKGTVWYRPAVVVATTNVADLQAGCYSNQPDSIMRRFVHVKVHSVEKSLDPSNHYANVFHGDIITYDRRDDKGNFTSSIHSEFNTTAELLTTLSAMAAVHKTTQEGVVRGSKEMFNTPPCVHNNIAQLCDKCEGVEECKVETQSGISPANLLSRLSIVGSSFSYFLLYLCFMAATVSEFAIFTYGPQVATYTVPIFRRQFSVVQLKSWVGVLLFAYSSFHPVWILPSLAVLCMPVVNLLCAPSAYLRQALWMFVRGRMNHVPWTIRPAHRWLICGLSLAAVIFLIRGLMSAADAKDATWAGNYGAQGGSDVPGTTPTVDPRHNLNDPQNVWKTTGVRRSSLPLTQEQYSLKAAQLVQKVISVKLVHKDKNTMATHVVGGYWVANAHFINRMQDMDAYSVVVPEAGKFNTVAKVFTKGEIQEIPGSDLVLIKLRIRRAKDIVSWLPTTLEMIKQRVAMAGMIVGPLGPTYFSKMTYFGPVKFTDVVLGEVSTDFAMRSKSDTVVGMCGLPYIADFGEGTVVPAFHAAGSDEGDAYGVCLTQKMVQVAIRAYEKAHTGVFTQSDDTGIVITNPETGILGSTEVVEPHYKSSAVQSPGGGYVEYFGKLAAANLTKPKSRVVPSFITQAVEVIFGEPRAHGPPGGGGPMAHPRNYQRHFDAVADNKTTIPVELLDVATESYMQRISDSREIKEQCHRLGPLSLDDTINGIPACWGIDGMPMGTSAGYPLGGAKRKLFDVQDGTDRVVAKPELLESVEAVEAIYAAGGTTRPIFVCNLKDEPTKLTKEKVRVFAGAPLVFSVLLRKYVLPLASLMSYEDCRESFECAVGINCFSQSWGKMERYLTQFGSQQIVAGDYAAFDMGMCSSVTERAYGVMLQMLQFSNRYTDRDIMIVRGLFTDLLFPTYLSQGEIFTACGTNPSGNNLTVLINCIVNSIYVRCGYYKEATIARCPLRFNDTVNLFTYGDDNIMGISRDVSDWFNHTSLSRALGTFGLTYTMADKISESVPLSDISDVDFLKRKFVEGMVDVEDGTGHWCHNNVVFAPLATASLMKTLHCYKGGALSIRDDSIDAMHTTLREMVQHGPEAYGSFRAKLIEVAELAGLTASCDFLEYEPALLIWFNNGWLPHRLTPPGIDIRPSEF